MFQLKSRDQEILSFFLNQYPHIKFYVFGSRVKNKAKEYSDIDLAYLGAKDFEISKLKAGLEESDLSIKVDLVDLNSISLEFKSLIENEMVCWDLKN
jgi:predicted nucleotidyltransferase